ncbi:hypothetical protein Pla111_27550 [Botrimarina hoheduenensis]|uniref:Uncharacterized protein n=1 Tax=Botrimarina hoheduenensis TaxID=2528000 RepID=A0A5C5VVR1_9BACT|nr:hypothetical protein Pla111_27550 [Botrimarina hoheduenensis]
MSEADLPPRVEPVNKLGFGEPAAGTPSILPSVASAHPGTALQRFRSLPFHRFTLPGEW